MKNGGKNKSVAFIILVSVCRLFSSQNAKKINMPECVITACGNRM